ncbi:hypothetical protein ACQJBY_019582 [Aegilops geniculata]
MEAYQKVQEFDLSSCAYWKRPPTSSSRCPPSTRSSDKSACKALDDVSTFINCTRVWSVGEDITMIVFSEDGEGGAGSWRHVRGEW